MRAIVTSQQDIAGTNVYSELAKNFGFEEEGEFEGMPLYKKGKILLVSTKKNQTKAEHLDRFFSPDYYVFASRHKAEAGRKTLTVHVPGNLAENAKVGGKPKEIAYAEPCAMKAALVELQIAKEEMKLPYIVSLEATHHGPTGLKKPVLFIEVGSSEEEWKDKKAVRAVARASIKAAENTQEFPKGIGIGGNHYAPVHTKAVLETPIALGHIIPSYAIDKLDKDVFAKAVSKCGAEFGFLDRKGTRKWQKEKINKLSIEIGLEFKRRKDFFDGHCFEIDENFFYEAERIGRKEIEDKIVSLGGVPRKRKDGRLSNKIYSKEDITKEVIKTCAEVLKSKYEVEVKNRLLVLKETKLDPKKAIEFGVKPGPLLGLLAAGREIEINGRIIKPEMVTTKREKFIEVSKEIFKYI